jgi:hypothetical protein
MGNIAHAVLSYLPTVAIQIGAAAVPPMALLAALHAIALAVRAGASGRVYYWAVGATALIGVGAREFHRRGGSDARHRLQLRDCVGLPRDHRRGSGR